MDAGDRIQKCMSVSEVVEELKRMKDIGLPITLINLVGYLRSMVSVLCMGRLGRLDLAGGALAVGFTNVTGYSVLAGLAMGMEPLCSQALGSRNRALASRTLYHTIALLLLASLPISFLWINLHKILLFLRQDPDVALVAARYCRYAVPDLITASFLHPVRVYHRSRNTLHPLMWCTSISLLLHLPLTLTLSSRLAVPGVALANSATNFLTLLLLLIHTSMYPSSGEDLGDGPPEISRAGSWCRLLRLAVPSCLGVCLEWWWYELMMTIAAGYLADPAVALSTAAIVIQTTSLMYTIPTTLSAAVSARVGNELGACRPRGARAAAAAAMGLAILTSCVSLAWTTLARNAWSKVFTSDGDVLELTNTILPVIGVCELANFPQTTGCGVLRGSARPGIGAVINLVSFYVVGAPVALFLAFKVEMGFLGLCLGLLAAQLVCASAIGIVIFRTDWEKEALKSVDLVGTPSIMRLEEECELLKDVGI
ncbi:protein DETOXIFICATION 55 [Typha angustifolia]|uniref:protein DETOXIFICATION 55 n=1 Tax=Typha angustifolia TaxID=59011 RepID=UPI003C2AF125